MFDFEKNFRINMLLDFYNNLLTDKQREYMELYYNSDLSLSEIAQQFGVSRNAVYDNISRTIKLLESYEEKLQLYYKFSLRENVYNKIKQEYSDEKLINYINELENYE